MTCCTADWLVDQSSQKRIRVCHTVHQQVSSLARVGGRTFCGAIWIINIVYHAYVDFINLFFFIHCMLI